MSLRYPITKEAVKWLTLIIFLSSSSVLFSQNSDIRLLRSLNSSEALPSDDFFRFISNSEVFIGQGIPVGIAVTGFIRMIRNYYAVLP